MREEKIFTEDPEAELWRELLQYSYKSNIERYFEEHSVEYGEEVIDCIIGSFLQAYEYYRTSSSVNLQIQPLLLYYGTTNLLFGMSCLKTGRKCEIKNHGMSIEATEINHYIGEARVKFENPYNGGLHVFARMLGYEEDLTRFGYWTLKEFFASIAEIDLEYRKCYSEKYGNIIMLDVVNTANGKIQKIYCGSSEREDLQQVIDKVKGFSKAYLIPQLGNDKTGREYFILRNKMNGEIISKFSFSGQPYLQAGTIKNGKLLTIPTVINMYISLFVMGSLCRYNPGIWSPFVLNDSTGERLLVEKFLYYARRMIPNIVLNKIGDVNITYVKERYEPKDIVKLVGEHEVQDLVKREVYSQLQRERVMK